MAKRLREQNVREKIDIIYKLNDEVSALLEEESDEFKKVLDKKAEVRMIQREGKPVEVTTGELLEEVRVTGINGEASGILKQDFPRLFEVAEEREKKNTEMHDYIQKEFGFSFRHMGVADYIKLT
ncbi:MAG: hypothetical protein WD361_10515, partial [Gracilimonas sp.]